MSNWFADILVEPANPRYTGTPELWEALEVILNTGLPDDYKQFINRYGAGVIGGEIEIYSPFCSDSKHSLIPQNLDWLPHLRRMREIAFMTNPLPFYPERGGLLLCGRGDNGDIFWKTDGNPNDWRIWLFDSNQEAHEVYDNLYSLIALFLSSQLKSISNISPMVPKMTGNQVFVSISF